MRRGNRQVTDELLNKIHSLNATGLTYKQIGVVLKDEVKPYLIKKIGFYKTADQYYAQKALEAERYQTKQNPDQASKVQPVEPLVTFRERIRKADQERMLQLLEQVVASLETFVNNQQKSISWKDRLFGRQ